MFTDRKTCKHVWHSQSMGTRNRVTFVLTHSTYQDGLMSSLFKV